MRPSILLLVVAGCAPQGSTMIAEAPRPTALSGPIVLASRTCPAPNNRPCLILEVADLHTDATSENKGFEELRARAISLGADAVIGAEFEHGEAGASHLSGMIVRYGDPLPPYVDIGKVESPSDPNSEDKGLSALVEQGRAMGADRVVDVIFEHGDDGTPGRIRGRAVKYTR